jgi:hypothetical protein
MEIFRNHTGVMIDVARLSWSLFRSIFGNYLYQKAERRFGPDKFKALTQKALDKALQKEDNRIVWNEILSKSKESQEKTKALVSSEFLTSFSLFEVSFSYDLA